MAGALLGDRALSTALFDEHWRMSDLGWGVSHMNIDMFEGPSLARIEPEPGLVSRWSEAVQRQAARGSRRLAFCTWAVQKLCERYTVGRYLFDTDVAAFPHEALRETLAEHGLVAEVPGAERHIACRHIAAGAGLSLGFVLREPNPHRPARTRRVLQGDIDLDDPWTGGSTMSGRLTELTTTCIEI